MGEDGQGPNRRNSMLFIFATLSSSPMVVRNEIILLHPKYWHTVVFADYGGHKTSRQHEPFGPNSGCTYADDQLDRSFGGEKYSQTRISRWFPKSLPLCPPPETEQFATAAVRAGWPAACQRNRRHPFRAACFGI